MSTATMANGKQKASTKNGKGRAPAAIPAGAPPDHPNALPLDTPHEVARAIMHDHFFHPDSVRLKFYQQDFYKWTGAHYQVVPTSEMNGHISRFANAMFEEDFRFKTMAYTMQQARIDADEDIPKDQLIPKPKKRCVSKAFVSDVRLALEGDEAIQVTYEEHPALPVWIDDAPHPDELPGDMIPFTNALVHLPSLVAGKVVTKEPTPAFFNKNLHAFRFIDDAAQPVAWLTFLKSIWRDDQPSIDTLQEWLGYLFLPTANEQKILLIKGPTRSGKGTIGRLIKALFGSDNVAFPTLDGLADAFGLANIAGKKVAIVPEAKVGDKTDVKMVIGKLLSVSGQDTISVNRKNKEEKDLQLGAKFMVFLNEIQAMRELSEAFANRFVILTMTESFLNREDKTLDKRLADELPNIFLWAMEGLARLQQRGHFVEPKSSAETRVQLETSNSKVAGFFHRRCQFAADRWVGTEELYQAYVEDCREQGIEHRFVLRKEDLCKQMQGFYASKIKHSAKRTGFDEKRVQGYKGVHLLPKDDAPDLGPNYPLIWAYLTGKGGSAPYHEIVSDLECVCPKEDVDQCGVLAAAHIEKVSDQQGQIIWSLAKVKLEPTPAAQGDGFVIEA